MLSACHGVIFTSTFNHTRSFRVWSFTIACNLIKNEYRRNGNQAKLAEKYKPMTDETHNHDMWASNSRTNLKDILSMFNEDDRGLFYLRFGEELKLSEIAEIQKQPLGTIKSRMSRMMKKLSGKLIFTGGENELKPEPQ